MHFSNSFEQQIQGSKIALSCCSLFVSAVVVPDVVLPVVVAPVVVILLTRIQFCKNVHKLPPSATETRLRRNQERGREEVGGSRL